MFPDLEILFCFGHYKKFWKSKERLGKHDPGYDSERTAEPEFKPAEKEEQFSHDEGVHEEVGKEHGYAVLCSILRDYFQKNGRPTMALLSRLSFHRRAVIPISESGLPRYQHSHPIGRIMTRRRTLSS